MQDAQAVSPLVINCRGAHYRIGHRTSRTDVASSMSSPTDAACFPGVGAMHYQSCRADSGARGATSCVTFLGFMALEILGGIDGADPAVLAPVLPG